MGTDAEELRQLGDPEFMKLWSAARTRLTLTPADSPEHERVRETYAALMSEYRRRIEGTD